MKTKTLTVALVATLIILASCEVVAAKATNSTPAEIMPPVPPTVSVSKKVTTGKTSETNTTNTAPSSKTANQTAQSANIIIGPPTITNVDFPAIGTPEKITAFAVHTVNRIFTFSWGYKTNGQSVPFYGAMWYGNLGTSPYIYGPLTNKTQIDQQCRLGINAVLTGLMTNTDPSIDKNQGLTVFVACKAYSGLPSLNTFYVYYTRVYLAGTNSSYLLPDLSGISAQINDNIPLYLPDLQWARYDVGYAGNDATFEVDDEWYEPPGPIDSDGFLDLPTGYMASSSSTNGAFWMKTTFFTSGSKSSLYIYDGDGNRRRELDSYKNGTNAIITINGGYSGQEYTLQCSTNLVHWSDYISYYISPVPDSLPWFITPITDPPMFFRTSLTNIVP